MKLTKARLKQIIKEEIEDIAAGEELGTTEPQFTGASPEADLSNLIHAGEKLAAMDAEERAQFLQQFLGDEQVLALVDALTTPGASLASVGY